MATLVTVDQQWWEILAFCAKRWQGENV